MHSYTPEAAIAAKRWSVHLRWAGTPKKQEFSTIFDPQQPLERDTAEPHTWPNVYVADALLREPIRIVRAQQEQTVAWPKHANASAPGVFERCHPVRFITGHGAIPMPTS